MSINVFQLLETVLGDDVVRTLGARFGLPPDLTRRIAGAAAPAIVAALMHRGSTPEGARSLFSTIMSPDVNALIGRQLPDLLTHTAALAQLEATGRDLIHKATGANVGALTDAVAAQTGAPQSTSYALTGVVGAVIMGILKQHFTASQGFVGQLPSLLGHQLPSVNASLSDRLASAVGLGSAAAFATSILRRLKDVSAHLDHPQPAVRPVAPAMPPQTVGDSTPPIAPEKRGHHWLWWLLAALALIIAIFALRACQSRDSAKTEAGASSASSASAADVASAAVPASAASDAASATVAAGAIAVAASDASDAAASAAAAPAPTADAHLAFTVDQAGVPTVTATLGSEAEKARLVDALTQRFGAGKFVANVNVDPATKPAPWLDRLDGLLPLMALPGAEVKIDGTHVELSGTAADAKAGWLDKLKALFGAGFEVGAFNVQQAVASATQSFRDAVKDLFGASGSCAPADVAKTLNLQVVNFTTGSSVVPASAAEDLQQSAKLLKQCAQRGHAVKLEVAGYSDNVGDKAVNLALSKTRAQAVRTYLVTWGAPVATLAARGYGEANPVDSNATESGRFHNRRIAFVAK
ncbi:OmpA family protein [Paraburkholderia acidisoli]|uniref:OmpA family protein n=1 Tax=Paraburkholderia acidisoli TaxID=2571748 RepID=A0A7Z2GIY5_9BURK|nr:OmpA family protein [Paraburkholderia acidisoli]QGZ62642.1 OmpA family protein [Paraburkholderia acidisoli]